MPGIPDFLPADTQNALEFVQARALYIIGESYYVSLKQFFEWTSAPSRGTFVMASRGSQWPWSWGNLLQQCCNAILDRMFENVH